jgi:hypothetical protein
MLVGNLVGCDHLLLMYSGPYGIMFMNVCAVVTVTMAILLKDFGPYGIICMTMYVYCFGFSRNS